MPDAGTLSEYWRTLQYDLFPWLEDGLNRPLGAHLSWSVSHLPGPTQPGRFVQALWHAYRRPPQGRDTTRR